jgi:hypothetical protein
LRRRLSRRQLAAAETAEQLSQRCERLLYLRECLLQLLAGN